MTSGKLLLRALGMVDRPVRRRVAQAVAPRTDEEVGARPAAPPNGSRRSPGAIRPSSIGIDLDTSAPALGEPRPSTDLLDDIAGLRKRIDEDGYLFLPGFFDPEEVAAARRQVVEWLDAQGLLDRGYPPWEARAADDANTLCESDEGRFPKTRALLNSPRMLDFYARFLGGRVRSYDHIWMRLVSPGNVTGPHLDIVYMGRGTSRLYTSWAPLGDVRLEHGSLLILEGSHRKQRLCADYGRMDIDRDGNWRKLRFRHGKFFRGGDYSRNPRAVQRQFGLRWVTTDYQAGDLVIMTAQTMHGSLDNVSDVIRISADTRYQLASEPADERWIGEHPIGHSRAV